MLPTQSSGPGAFGRFDLSRVPSPCFVIDEVKLRSNLSVLQKIGKDSGAQVLLALKAFSMWSLSNLVDEYLDGCCASGLWEAKLARDKKFADLDKGKILSSFSPAYSPSEFEEICELSDHLIFNHPGAYGIEQASERGVSTGLRINPELSLGLDPKYDPCALNSRLGWPLSQVSGNDFAYFEGLHFHTLCEQNFSPLLKTWRKIEENLGSVLEKFKWINLGGGHHCTRQDYDRDGLIGLVSEISEKYDCQLFLEPGEAVALDAGILVGEVLDIMNTGHPHALLDLSPTCHTPDVIEAPYRPALLQEVEHGEYKCFLGGASCLTADSFGEYRFEGPLQVGERLAFLDQGHYTMVKTNTFNGVRLPSIALWNSESDALSIIREFSYDEFVSRLS